MRQKRYAMARPSADSLAQVVVELPTQILSITIFDVILVRRTASQCAADPAVLRRGPPERAAVRRTTTRAMLTFFPVLNFPYSGCRIEQRSSPH